MDLSNEAKTPFGEMSRHEKMSMFSHHIDGGLVEVLYGEWTDANSPSWLPSGIYRAAPKPVLASDAMQVKLSVAHGDFHFYRLNRPHGLNGLPIGTMTIDYSDGKPIRAVWEADQC